MNNTCVALKLGYVYVFVLLNGQNTSKKQVYMFLLVAIKEDI